MARFGQSGAQRGFARGRHRREDLVGEYASWWGIAALSGIFLPTGETLNLGNFGSVAPVWRLADFAGEHHEPPI